jgi:hypothetical protein
MPEDTRCGCEEEEEEEEEEDFGILKTSKEM